VYHSKLGIACIETKKKKEVWHHEKDGDVSNIDSMCVIYNRV